MDIVTKWIRWIPGFRPSSRVRGGSEDWRAAGFEYGKKGECCGECRQVACVYDASDNTTQTLKVGEVKSYTCETVTCRQMNGSFITEKTKTECPYLSSLSCGPETVRFDNDECCKICEPSNCVRAKNFTHLHVNDCTSIETVEVTSCSGHCDDGSMYSMENDTMMHSCSCCREREISRLPVMLKCANSSEILHHYTYIESCDCTPTECENTGKNEYGQFTENNLETEVP